MNNNNLTMNSPVKLNNNYFMPVIGLGTWNMKDQTLIQAVDWALDLGYRHFDTARYYKNEKALGKAINQSSISRSDIFITSKVWPNDFGLNKAIKAFEASIQELELEYIDQYLIHWPSDKKSTHDTWRALTKLYSENKCKSIGVSNFSIKDLENLKDINDTSPAVNQIEFHPFKFKAELLEYCRNENIAVVAYSPINEGRGLNNHALLKIASKYKKTPAQIMLRWAVQHDTIVIPKSSNMKRLAENISIFDFKIDNNDMQRLNSL